MPEITVYEFTATSFRVVNGNHVESPNATVRIYPHAQLAYAAETRTDIKAALLLIDPTANQGGVLSPVRKVRIPSGLSSTSRIQHDADISYTDPEPSSSGRVIYKGYTCLQLTLGAWVVAALTGIPFASLSDAKRAIDRLPPTLNRVS